MPAHPTLDERVVRDFVSALAAALGERLLEVSLYGSRARGEGRVRSDFDLVVVVDRASGEVRDAVHRQATEIELDANVDLSTKIVDRERFAELSASDLPFWRNFRRDQRILWPRT